MVGKGLIQRFLLYPNFEDSSSVLYRSRYKANILSIRKIGFIGLNIYVLGTQKYRPIKTIGSCSFENPQNMFGLRGKKLSLYFHPFRWVPVADLSSRLEMFECYLFENPVRQVFSLRGSIQFVDDLFDLNIEEKHGTD